MTICYENAESTGTIGGIQKETPEADPWPDGYKCGMNDTIQQ